MGERRIKATSAPLKNEEYADQLKDNRAVKKCREKKVFTLFNFYTNCVFGL